MLAHQTAIHLPTRSAARSGFTRGGVHFIGLNTADIDDQHYYGHVDSLQLVWLERDLARVPPAMAVVTFDHIPFITSFKTVNGYERGATCWRCCECGRTCWRSAATFTERSG